MSSQTWLGAPGLKLQVPSSKFQAPSSKFQGLSSQFSALSFQLSAFSMRDARDRALVISGAIGVVFFRPSGADSVFDWAPTAHAVGCILPPLRGRVIMLCDFGGEAWFSFAPPGLILSSIVYPQLTLWAVFFRRSAAMVPELRRPRHQLPKKQKSRFLDSMELPGKRSVPFRSE
jgi:hypothetical protein